MVKPEYTDEDMANVGRALMEIAETASRVCGGSWSVDLLQTERGWFLTDMAEARSSYHWEDCPNILAAAAA